MLTTLLILNRLIYNVNINDTYIYMYMCLVRVILSFPTRRHYKTYLNVTQTGCLVKAKQDPDDQI